MPPILEHTKPHPPHMLCVIIIVFNVALLETAQHTIAKGRKHMIDIIAQASIPVIDSGPSLLLASYLQHPSFIIVMQQQLTATVEAIIVYVAGAIYGI